MVVFLGILIAILFFIIGYKSLMFFGEPLHDKNGNPICDSDGDLVYDGLSGMVGMFLFFVCIIAGIGFFIYSIFCC